MTIVVPTPADLLPTPPTTADPASFDSRMDATLLAQQSMVPRVNKLAQDTYTNAQDASASATAASGSASAAAISASSALSSKNTAQAAETAAVQAFDDFDRRYLGAKASAPATDNDGNPLQAGALFFLIGTGMRARTGSAWEAAYLPASGYQETLVSGTNIKTLNGGSILGSGNVSILGASSIGDSIYKPDTTITVTDANGAKWLRTGSWVPIDAEVTAGLSAVAGYAESLWMPVSAPSFNVIRLTVAADEFWMCGPAGGLAYSADGITWTSVNIATANGVQGIATNGAGLYVAVQSISVHRSTDKGASWGAATSTGVTGTIVNIAYGAGVFVVITGNTTGKSIATSPDGVTWTLRTNPVAQVLQNIIFAGGQFVAVGNAGTVLTSPDGTTWTSRTFGSVDNLGNIAYVAGRYVAGGSNPRSSADAVTWAATTGMSSSQNFVSTGTVLFGKAANALWSSTNGTSASAVPGGSTDPLRPNNLYFAATSSAVLSVNNTGGAGVVLRPDVANQTQSFAASSVVGDLNLYARYA